MHFSRGNRLIGLAVAVAAALAVGVAPARSANDVTPPTITLVTPAANASYAQNATVNASYSCSDASGVAACAGTVKNGTAIPTQALGTQTFKVTAYDNVGNKTTLERAYNVVDATAPEIKLSSPVDGATYAKNSAVYAKFACYDVGVGIDSCVGTVPNGSSVPTGTTGAKSFTVTAQDRVGNTRTKTVSYTVA